MPPEPTATMLFERVSDEILEVEFAGGRAVAFCTRGPDKPVNEDAVGLLPHPEGGLLVVADGMGGQNAGERASRLALDSLCSSILAGARDGQPLRHVALDGVEAANRAILELGVGAGSTLAAFALSQGRAHTLHVGDSMALHVGQRGRVKSQTISHSPTGYAVESGLLDERDALQHADRHIVSNFVGMAGMRIEVGPSHELALHDTLLVASDGLTDNLTLDEIVATVRKGPLVAAACRLAELAGQRMRGAGDGLPSKPDDLSFVLFRRART